MMMKPTSSALFISFMKEKAGLMPWEKIARSPTLEEENRRGFLEEVIFKPRLEEGRKPQVNRGMRARFSGPGSSREENLEAGTRPCPVSDSGQRVMQQRQAGTRSRGPASGGCILCRCWRQKKGSDCSDCVLHGSLWPPGAQWIWGWLKAGTPKGRPGQESRRAQVGTDGARLLAVKMECARWCCRGQGGKKKPPSAFSRLTAQFFLTDLSSSVIFSLTQRSYKSFSLTSLSL